MPAATGAQGAHAAPEGHATQAIFSLVAQREHRHPLCTLGVDSSDELEFVLRCIEPVDVGGKILSATVVAVRDSQNGGSAHGRKLHARGTNGVDLLKELKLRLRRVHHVDLALALIRAMLTTVCNPQEGATAGLKCRHVRITALVFKILLEYFLRELRLRRVHLVDLADPGPRTDTKKVTVLCDTQEGAASNCKRRQTTAIERLEALDAIEACLRRVQLEELKTLFIKLYKKLA